MLQPLKRKSILMDLEFFLKLEELCNEYNATGQVLSLSEEHRESIKSIKFDYEIFRFDFDLTCRFIYFLSRLERSKFSSTYGILIKYVMVLSTFLKNRTTTKLSTKNEAYLTKATDSLVADFRMNFTYIFSSKMYESARLFIAFSIVNIHEVVGISRTAPRNPSVFFFLCNESDLVSAENALIRVSFWMSDFKIVGIAIDETVESNAFKKYSQQPRPKFRQSFENQKLLIFGGFSLLFLFFIIFSIEFYDGYVPKSGRRFN